MPLRFYEICFKITAIVNLVAGIAALASIETHLELFYAAAETNILLRFYHYNFWIVVVLMGIAYWHLGAEPIRNRVVALIGAVGKLCAAASWLYLFTIGYAKPIVLLAVIFDGFFGALLAWFYWTTRDAKTPIESRV